MCSARRRVFGRGGCLRNHAETSSHGGEFLKRGFTLVQPQVKSVSAVRFFWGFFLWLATTPSP